MSTIEIFVAVITVLMLRCDSLFALNDSWPSGEYSLPKPLSGCPKLWKEGWLQQDLEDDAAQYRSKLFSSNFHMNASIVDSEFVVRRFCTKVTDQFEGTITWNPWPKGSYCIYKKQRCPQDMVEGSIYFDDEDSYYGNKVGGILPDLDTGHGVNSVTGLYYCCQNQAEWYTPIRLPTEKPFYLLPYGSRNCQRVKWAISSLEYIIYDTENDGNDDRFTGHHVFTDKVKSLPKIFYCYYEGCQYSFQDDHGFITSSNFLNNFYPDFQFCSWSITVNASMIIFMEFHTINIPNCEENYLDIYDGKRDNSPTLLARFCGENATSGAKVTSKMNNLYIVLKSGNNSARNTKDSLGFSAEYVAFRQDSWPSGEYSLPKPLSGCPKLWKEGWLQQDLEDDAEQNQNKSFSSNFHMNASIVESNYVVRRFCTKLSKVTDHSAVTITWNPWPKGSYCIYRKNNRCPQDMVEGVIYFDDENSYPNDNKKGGILPDTPYIRDTILYYCCQNQGEWYKLVRLPTEKPFYLLPYGSRNCQRVKWAISSLEYIIYDTENSYWNGDSFTGHHVFTDKVKSLPKIFYCYYEGCQYSLQSSNGIITSSNFLNNSYPDFQFCSWSITVNASMRIRLEFQTINIPNCKENYLDIYDGERDNSPTLLARFCGENATFGAKVTSKMNNLYIVLKSGNNSAGNTKDWSKSLGFYGGYEAFRQEQATATTYSTTTIPPTNNSFNSGSKNNSFNGGSKNNSFNDGRKDLQDANSDNSSIYLSIILPILAILIILGIMGAIFYSRRQNKESNVAAPQAMQELNQDSRRYASHTPTSQTSPEFGVTSKTGTNPIYESGENAAYEYEPGANIHNTTDNVLYEPANELLSGNPVYEGIDDNVDSTYAEPFQ